MNIGKKPLIIITVLSLLVIAALSIGAWFLNSYHTLTVDIKRDNTAVTILRSDTEQEVKTIEQTSDLRLANGDYVLVPESTDADRPLSDQPYDVTIDGSDQTVVVDPELSAQYRQQIADENSAAIKSEIIKQNPVIEAFYDIVHIEILGHDGNWAAVVIDQYAPPGGMGDTYFALLHKQSDKWVTKTAPQIVLTSADYPDIPVKVLSDTNALFQNIESYR